LQQQQFAVILLLVKTQLCKVECKKCTTKPKPKQSIRSP
jgi:hypothetical protein